MRILLLPVAAMLIVSGCATKALVECAREAPVSAAAGAATPESEDPISDERLKTISEMEAVLPAAAALFASLAWSGENATLHYRLFSPTVSAGVSYPLVVVFDGSECGGTNGCSGGDPWSAIFCASAVQSKYRCFVAVPETPSKGSNLYEHVNALVADLCECLPVDPARVYATGFSTGSIHVCRTVAAGRGMFAAGVPVGGADPETAKAVGRTPFWVFHGDADAAMPAGSAGEFVRRLRKSRAGPLHTEYSGTGCDSRKLAYTNPRLFEWLFGQRRPD